jgi:hypothetical protein
MDESGDGKWERGDTIFLGKPARKMVLRIRRLRWWGNNKVTKLR